MSLAGGQPEGIVRALEHGGNLSWKYKDTPYEKVIDPDGLTTEYVRCIAVCPGGCSISSPLRSASLQGCVGLRFLEYSLEFVSQHD